MLTEEQKAVHSEYRKYLRIVEGIKGNMLNTLVNATEKSLPTLIREHVRQDFDCIYNDKYSIEELLSFSAKLKSDDEILAGHSGYISSKAIEAYIRFYANKILKFRKCYAASLNLTFRFISLTMSSSSSMMALRTSGA